MADASIDSTDRSTRQDIPPIVRNKNDSWQKFDLLTLIELYISERFLETSKGAMKLITVFLSVKSTRARCDDMM